MSEGKHNLGNLKHHKLSCRLSVVQTKQWLRWALAVQIIVPQGLVATVAFGVLAPSQDPTSAPDGEALVVLAASSLQDVLPVAAHAWARAGGTRVRFNFDATSRLAPQVFRGAPADVFISADGEWMRWLEERASVDPLTVLPLVTNQLVFVVPRDAASAPTTAAELERSGLARLALAGEDVPAGRYAKMALEMAGVWDGLASSVVRGGSVRGALEWVAAGEVDGGIVYRTDARAEGRVRVAFSLAGDGFPEVLYPGAVAAQTRNRERALEFLAFLRGPEATAIFSEAGFGRAAAGATPSLQQPLQVPSSIVDPWSAVRLSLVVALGAVILGLIPAVAVGWMLARRDFFGKSVVSMLFMAPLVVPPVITGFLILSVLGRRSAIGGFLDGIGLPIPFTILGAVIAAMVVGFPLYAMAIRGAFDTVDRRFEEVSWTLGVPRGLTFRRISLPLALPGIAAGAVLAFARALGEFGATVVLAGNMEGETRTIALAVYSLLESPSGRGAMWTLVIASITLSLVALLGFESLSRWQRRRLEDHHVH